ncbi:hypothetical protein JGH11_14920 [Dysgonomonas sp. Marseille-P4677]|uniref:hypothetical protein n=1 Tax=Dysgonomonas sp. Marseille-P4677 TaxID=2364790 RepID=UPI001914B246|nr:hypothetical protein [Dysgonomonas sp. Marseille-P4677]MBK5722166.1 hypothetical protein [Dysgonomonas sp. Marseille-P4677]
MLLRLSLYLIVNLNLNTQNSDTFYLNLNNTEALAGGEWNDWTQWLSQGLTQDEREYERPCPSSSSSSTSGSTSVDYAGTNVSASGQHSSSQVNPSNRNEITCAYGSVNCTPISC